MDIRERDHHDSAVVALRILDERGDRKEAIKVSARCR
jgi:hypothetical protein